MGPIDRLQSLLKPRDPQNTIDGMLGIKRPIVNPRKPLVSEWEYPSNQNLPALDFKTGKIINPQLNTRYQVSGPTKLTTNNPWLSGYSLKYDPNSIPQERNPLPLIDTR